MIFRESIQSDLDYMADHSMSRGIQKQCPEQVDYVYTLENDGAPLGIGGFKVINPCTAWCWVDISDKGHKNIKATFRALRDWIDIFAKEHKLVRLQAYVRPDFKEAIRMIEHLGFEQESIMKDFMPEGDAIMYIKLLSLEA